MSYEYIILNTKIKRLSTKVIIFAIKIGIDEIFSPYTIQAATPVRNKINVVSETSSAFFVLKVLIS